MSDVFIYPYNMESASVKALKAALGAKTIRTEGSKFKGNEDKLVINWGNSMEKEELNNCVVINKPDAVKLATNKRTFFETVQGQVQIPEFTTSKEQAEAWLLKGKTVVVREKLTGHSGEGIVLISNIQDWMNYDHSKAKLYVLYIPKNHEYRVHVMGGEVIDLQRKAIAPGVHRDHVNFQIRNHDNGFIFVRTETNERCPPQVREQAIEAVRLTGLDFGAVDVIWNDHRKTAYVLEINTAPGLEGQTVSTYIEALNKMYVEGWREKVRAKTVNITFSNATLDTLPPARPASRVITEEERDRAVREMDAMWQAIAARAQPAPFTTLDDANVQ